MYLIVKHDARDIKIAGAQSLGRACASAWRSGLAVALSRLENGGGSGGKKRKGLVIASEGVKERHEPRAWGVL